MDETRRDLWGRRQLPALALRVIREFVQSGRIVPEVELAAADLGERAGVFVSVYCGGRLRGCMGVVEPDRPLWHSLREMAIAAATRDLRFTPLCAEELDGLEVEVTVLSPPERIEGLREVEIGRHGLVVRKGSRSGVMLPQVASRMGWTPEELLVRTCNKASIRNAETAQIFRFTGEIYRSACGGTE